jgi:hypothetical protein
MYTDHCDGLSVCFFVQTEDELVKKKRKVAPAGTSERKVPSPVNRHAPICTVPVEDECKALGVPEEEEDLPPTPENEKEAIKRKFLVEMPADFYSFWSLCQSLSPDKPEGVLHFYSLDISSL